MDRTVSAPGSAGQERKEWEGYAALTVGIPTLTEVAGAAVWLAPVLGGPEQDVPLGNPFSLYQQVLVTHELVWSGQASAALMGLGAAACGVCVAAALGYQWVSSQSWRTGKRSKRSKRHPIDAQARYLARGKELADVGWKAITAKAADLNVALTDEQTPGVSIGRAVGSGQMLYGSFEDLHVDIWGPRGGKTTSRVIPAIMEAVGPVIATSNKRDVVDATRDPRSTLGGRTWIFDPQQVAAEPATWYWDPVAWVLGEEEGGLGAQQRSMELAGHFAAGGDADKRDSFFDPEGEDLLAGLFLAAAVGKRAVTQVFRWVTEPTNQEPIKILDANGYDMVAAALSDQYNAPERQRAGIFSTAKKMAACLKLQSISQWVTPPGQGEPPREAFDAVAFCTSMDTLYPLSLEGKASAGPLITALTAAVVDEATKVATRQGGRLRTPMLVALDEAANIVKWAQLPAQYSHFGSRGIIVMTILQSWAQGARCWGQEGMKALFSAANVKVLGSGLADAAHLREMADLVGSHYERVTSTSRTKGVVTQSESRTTEPTLQISDLAALPRGRAVVMLSGHRPVLVETVPWHARPYAGEVQDSITAHDPANQPQTAGRRTHLRAVPPIEQEGESA